MDNEIKQTYVTLEQSKWLKEIGLGIKVKQFYYSEEFKTTDIKIDIGLLNHNEHISKYSAPEQWQVVEWLRVNHGIWVAIRVSNNKFNLLVTNLSGDILHNDSAFKTPQEAYSAAFDYIRLNNLI
jgi:hypothetical protein